MKDLEATVARLSAVIVAVGLAPEATAEEATAHVQSIGNAAAAPLQAALEAAQTAAADASAAADAAAATAATATATASAATAQIATFREVLAATGVHLAADAPVDREAMQAAIEGRISAGASRIVAAAGHDPLPVSTSDEIDDPATIAATLRRTQDPREAGRLAQRLIDHGKASGGRN